MMTLRARTPEELRREIEATRATIEKESVLYGYVSDFWYDDLRNLERELRAAEFAAQQSRGRQMVEAAGSMPSSIRSRLRMMV